MITIPIFTRYWNIKTPIVYRYLDQKYIDEFFSSGRIRLSAFKLFKNYSDEQRGDKDEGENVLVGFVDGHTIVAKTQHGDNSFILSVSTEGSSKLQKMFKTTGYFKVNDTLGFGASIANRIPGFFDGIEGFCNYSEQRIIQKQLANFKFADLTDGPENKQINLDKLAKLASQIGSEDVFFVKQIKYRHQNEYRFIWNVAYQIEEALIIECPEAIKFCEKVT